MSPPTGVSPLTPHGCARGRRPPGRDRARPGGSRGTSCGDLPAPDRLGFASLALRQPRKGYRFGIDAVLLADFAAPLGGTSVLDLGTGCGVVLLLLARLLPDLRKGVGVEIQEGLCAFARANIEENGEGGRLSALCGDFRGRLPGVPEGSFDLVASNPPYRAVGVGRMNPDPSRAIARHEVACTMADLFRAAARHLAPGGRFATLALPGRLPDLLRCADAEGIAPLALRFVHSLPGRPSHLVLFAGTRGGRPELAVRAPLSIYREKGRYSADIDEIFRGLVRK